ncbi:hypothetical protein ACFPOU_04965, partial [Massilia jejuensis]
DRRVGHTSALTRFSVPLHLKPRFVALIGADLKSDQAFYIGRFARGGMSSGTVSGEAWANNLVPTLRQRARWLRESWAI